MQSAEADRDNPIASSEFRHLKVEQGSVRKTIFYCGRAQSDAHPPPSTFWRERATCPECLTRHEQEVPRAPHPR